MLVALPMMGAVGRAVWCQGRCDGNATRSRANGARQCGCGTLRASSTVGRDTRTGDVTDRDGATCAREDGEVATFYKLTGPDRRPHPPPAAVGDSGGTGRWEADRRGVGWKTSRTGTGPIRRVYVR